MIRWMLVIAMTLSTGLSVQAYEGPQQKGAAWVWTVEGDFKTIKNDVIEAIQANGLVVSYEAHAANMLARTAEAVESSTQIYDQAETLLFCKADLSHQLAAQNPHNIVLCPYGISLYSLVNNPTEIFVSIRLPALEVAAYSEVHNLLEKIISEALEWYQ